MFGGVLGVTNPFLCQFAWILSVILHERNSKTPTKLESTCVPGGLSSSVQRFNGVMPVCARLVLPLAAPVVQLVFYKSAQSIVMSVCTNSKFLLGPYAKHSTPQLEPEVKLIP